MRQPQWPANARSALPIPKHILTPTVPPLEPIRSFRPLMKPWLDSTLQSLLSHQPRAVVVGKPSWLALELIERLAPTTPVLMDIMDDLPAFLSGRSAQWMEFLMGEVQRRADEIWVSSAGLLERLESSGVKKSVKLVRNGVDSKRALQFKYCWQSRSRPLIAGYVGTLAQWFDWEGVFRAAVANPSMEFRLYGPLDSRAAMPANRPFNVTLLGPISPSDIPATLGEFDIGLIPFRPCRLTESVDPIKYYEYRAAGLGVVSTAFGDMRTRGPESGVFAFDDPKGLAQAHEETRRRRAHPEVWEEEILAFSWDRRFNATNLDGWFETQR